MVLKVRRGQGSRV